MKSKSLIRPPTKQFPYPTILVDELNKFKMICSNEDKVGQIIHGGVLKQWVGIGWIEVDKAPNEAAKKKYPTVVNEQGRPCKVIDIGIHDFWYIDNETCVSGTIVKITRQFLTIVCKLGNGKSHRRKVPLALQP